MSADPVAERIRLGCQVPDELVGRRGDVHLGHSLGPARHDAGFGGKVGGTIAMVPCFLLLGMVVAGTRLNWRRILLVGVSGLALFAVFALISYLVPATGHSDIGVFAGNTLHGRSGGLLLRKINSNLGSLSVNAFSPLIPIVAIVTGLMLWRPAWFRLTTMPAAFAAEPLLRPVLGVLWLMPVLGWFANDSGVIVTAAVLPFALPLAIAILAAAAYPAAALWY